MPDPFPQRFQTISNRSTIVERDRRTIYDASNELLSVIGDSGLHEDDEMALAVDLARQQRQLKVEFTEFNIQRQTPSGTQDFTTFFFDRYVQRVRAYAGEMSSRDKTRGKKLTAFARRLPAAIRKCIEIRSSPFTKE